MGENKAFFETDYVTIYFEEKHQVVVARWFKMTSVDNIKHGTDQYLEAMQHYGTTYILADLRQIKGSFTAIGEWLSTDWGPRAYQAGLKAIGMLPSSDIFVKFSLDMINKQYEKGDQLINFRVFTSEEDGFTWLNSQ